MEFAQHLLARPVPGEMLSRRSHGLLGVVTAVACVAAIAPMRSASSQEVHGIARVVESGLPASETTVVLVDSSGTIVAGTIADPNGHFTLSARSPGTYRVRARRIGFVPDSSALLQLAAGHTVGFDPKLAQFAVGLEQVRIGVTRRCVSTAESGAAVFRLWQDAQSALTATVVSAENLQVGFVLRRFERKVDPSTAAVRESKTWDTRTINSEPYASIPAESLAVHGFVVPRGKQLIYYAPDARTLTSDAFAQTHCYRPMADTGHPGLLGLAFSPSRQSASAQRYPGGVRDVSGVLWLDRASGELRFLSFQYGGASSQSGASDGGAISATASGRVDYQRLDSGAWVVSHWIINMPVVLIQYAARLAPGATLGSGLMINNAAVSTVAEMWQAGGDVLSTFAPGNPASATSRLYGAVTGRFVDSVPGNPSLRSMPGIHVALIAKPPSQMTLPADTASALEMGSGRSNNFTTTLQEVITDTSGSFILDSIPSGDYVVRASSARLDTLDIGIAERAIHISPAMRQTLLTVVPSAAVVATRLCPHDDGPQVMLVHGTVRDSGDGRAVPGARIMISHFDYSEVPRHLIVATQDRTVMTGPDGRYIVCGLPHARELLVRARVGARDLPPVPLAAASGSIAMANFSVNRSAHHSPLSTKVPAEAQSVRGTRSNETSSAQTLGGTTGGMTGSVRDTSGRAVTGATVRLDSAEWVPVDSLGTFAFTRIRAGRHVLETRALGFDPHAWYVTVRPERTSTAPLTLLRVTTFAAVQVIAAADTTPLEPASFAARRLTNSGGIFIDRQQIDRRGAQRMSDIVRDVPGVASVPINGPLGTRDYIFVMRGVGMADDRICPIQYYLDGHPFPVSDNIDRDISLGDVVAIEIYPGASQVPPQFKGPSARCGVIVVWSAGGSGK